MQSKITNQPCRSNTSEVELESRGPGGFQIQEATMDTFECWLLIDANGNHGCGPSEDDARENYISGIGPLEESGGFRFIQVRVKATLPTPSKVNSEVIDGTRAVVASALPV